jgi:hypothetical protein
MGYKAHPEAGIGHTIYKFVAQNKEINIWQMPKQSKV